MTRGDQKKKPFRLESVTGAGFKLKMRKKLSVVVR